MNALENSPKKTISVTSSCFSEIKNQLSNIQEKMQDNSKELFYVPKILFTELHLTHAILAFHTSPIQEAAIVCMDEKKQ